MKSKDENVVFKLIFTFRFASSSWEFCIPRNFDLSCAFRVTLISLQPNKMTAIESSYAEQEGYYHPYTPYTIQRDFMSTLYSTLEEKKVGIFESPTGTGKTLSLICSSMSWLRDFNRREFEKEMDNATKGDENEPAWVKEHTRQIKEAEISDKIKEFEASLKQAREKEKQDARTAQLPEGRKRIRHEVSLEEDDDFYVLKGEEDAVDSAVSVLLASLEETPVDTSLPDDKVKIYFASRTHSQLSQFVGQLRLPQFPPSIKALDTESTKEITLSSRKHLCIHPKVSKYSSVAQMNDACHDMAKKPETKCKFMLNPHEPKDAVRQATFRNKALAKIRDIEDLADVGRELKICPYYASREAANWCEVIALPYQLLLQKEAREALGIKLDNSIVIIDEAHNLLDVISSLYSISITHTEISSALSGLQVYHKKFSKRLSGYNLMNLSKLIQAVKSLDTFMKGSLAKPGKETASGKEIKISEFFAGSSTLDMVNSHELEKFIKKTKLVFKIESYLEAVIETKLVLGKVMSFLSALGNPSWEGKFFYGRSEKKELQLEYILLDPSYPFKEIVTQARCAVLAGGTMKPMDDYLNYLLPYLEESQITQFSCDHIIPDDNLVVLPISSAGGTQFSFTFAERNSVDMIKALGQTIANLMLKIPHGMVVFFPSYAYMNSVIDIWKKYGLYNHMNEYKKIFTEPTETSVEEVLVQFGDEIQRCKDIHTGCGALLFSVVGGKMSEGINFSDDLARGVVMIGLPFPNAFSAEMVAKREYVQDKVRKAGGSLEDARAKARDFYENICMRAVNQCVGRSVRHAKDYSSIILIDHRYAKENIQKKLSFWVQKRIQPTSTAVEACSALGRFFSTK